MNYKTLENNSISKLETDPNRGTSHAVFTTKPKFCVVARKTVPDVWSEKSTNLYVNSW